jgi:hypothetical protein
MGSNFKNKNHFTVRDEKIEKAPPQNGMNHFSYMESSAVITVA